MQQNLPEYERNGIQVFGMSYDSPAVMARFAKKYEITYPLLGDGGSKAIRKLGLLNTELPEGHRIQGVAFPGYFLTDEKGVVAARKFYQAYQPRDVPLAVLTSGFGVTPAERPGAATRTGRRVKATAWLDSPTYRRAQVIGLNVEIEIDEGWHTYGAPVPEGFYVTKLTVEPSEGVQVKLLPLPKPKPFELEGLDDAFFVHEGTFLARAELTFLGAKGNQTIKAALHYQACNDESCMPPDKLEFELPIEPLPLVAPAN